MKPPGAHVVGLLTGTEQPQGHLQLLHLILDLAEAVIKWINLLIWIHSDCHKRTLMCFKVLYYAFFRQQIYDSQIYDFDLREIITRPSWEYIPGFLMCHQQLSLYTEKDTLQS